MDLLMMNTLRVTKLAFLTPKSPLSRVISTPAIIHETSEDTKIQIFELDSKLTSGRDWGMVCFPTWRTGSLGFTQ